MLSNLDAYSSQAEELNRQARQHLQLAITQFLERDPYNRSVR